MVDRCIIVRKEEGIAWATFNRPHVLNALDSEMLDELTAAVDDIDGDDNVKVMILTGAGRAFCVGADINLLLSLYSKGSQAIKDAVSYINSLVLKLVNLQKFIIASVNGDAVGGGCNLALAADIVIASEKARFGQVFINIGLAPDTGGAYILPRLIGPSKAKELFATGDIISAVEAFQLGLVNKVVPADQLESVTLEMARKLAHNPAKAMGLTKTLVNKSLATNDLATVLEYELEAQTICLQSEDAKKLLQKFLTERKRQNQK